MGTGRQRPGGRADGVLEETVRLADERQQVGQQVAVVLRFEHVDVAAADAAEIRDSDLPQIRATLAEEYLAGTEDVRERRAFRDVPPSVNRQVAGIDVFESDVAREAGGFGIRCPFRAQAHDVSERDTRRPAGLQAAGIHGSSGRRRCIRT